jgi:hypothetical protein
MRLSLMSSGRRRTSSVSPTCGDCCSAASGKVRYTKPLRAKPGSTATSIMPPCSAGLSRSTTFGTPPTGPESFPSAQMRRRPGFSVIRSLPSGRRARPRGNSSVASGCNRISPTLDGTTSGGAAFAACPLAARTKPREAHAAIITVTAVKRIA